jgi:hypothetical protein
MLAQVRCDKEAAQHEKDCNTVFAESEGAIVEEILVVVENLKVKDKNQQDCQAPPSI